MFDYPEIFRVRQQFERPLVEDIPAEVERQLASIDLAERIKPGQSVAITAGSRGIANIPLIVKAVVDHLKGLGARPFIVPAMGSHGGGTAEGQMDVLATLGVTERFCGCEIRAGMETVVVCRAAEGFPVHFDKHAYEADHVVVCGRVKPHTNFVGDVESGLMKMLLIGLGKHEGAKIYHRAIIDYDFPTIIKSVAGEVLARTNIAGGLAVVENGYDETAKIAAVRREEFEQRERELLVLARKWMPKLPFAVADFLIVDEMGKNVSGSGMDTNVIGRKFVSHSAAADEYPKIKQIFVRSLTPETKGNAAGIGLAEWCRKGLVRQMNLDYTRINCLTGGGPVGAMMPLDYETDRDVFAAALPTLGLVEPPDARILWITNTLDVAEVECSVAYLDEARDRGDLEILSDPRPFEFDRAGNLATVKELGMVALA